MLVRPEVRRHSVDVLELETSVAYRGLARRHRQRGTVIVERSGEL